MNRSDRVMSMPTVILVVAIAAVLTSGAAAAEERESRLTFSLGAGVMTSGDIASVEVTDGETNLMWLLPGSASTGFNASRFVLTMDEDFAVSPSCVYDLTDRFQLSATLTWSQVDVTAETIRGEVAELVLYDRLTFTRIGIAGVAKLFTTPSHAYLFAGPSYVNLDATGEPEFDGSGIALTAGIGYKHVFSDQWFGRLEIRDTVTQMDLGDFDPDYIESGALGFEMEERGPQHFVELMMVIDIIL